MFFAKSFDIFSVIGIVMIEVANMEVNIKVISEFCRVVIWDIVNAAPVLDFWNRKSVRKDVAMISVFIEPKRIRNWERFSLPVISDPIIAAWLEPNPGSSEHIGDIRIVARVGFMIWYFGRVSFWMVCLGGIVFELIEFIIVEVPKSPVKRGRSGFCIWEFNEEIPRNPASVKISIAFILDSFSL